MSLWVTSADYNRDPEALGVFASFVMIFISLFGAVFARVKQLRKLLIGIGISNLLIALSLFLAFYPQNAFFAIESNTVWLVDMLTPFYIGESVGVFFYSCMLFLIVLAIWCFVTSRKIKRGAVKKCKKPQRFLAVFTAAFALFAIVNTLMYPVSHNYIKNLPTWLQTYDLYFTEETEKIFNSVMLCGDYSVTEDILKQNGYVTFDSFEDSLGRVEKKQFRANSRKFELREGYEYWFNPNMDIEGGGYVGIKTDSNEKVTGKLIGDIKKNVYESYGVSKSCNMTQMLKTFESLNIGDPKNEVMNDFIEKYGEAYTLCEEIKDGKRVQLFRISCKGYIDDLQLRRKYFQMDKDESVMFLEITFINDSLALCDMYYTEYTKNDLTPTVKSVK